MTSEQFAYWLQGFVELQGSVPTEEQWQGIKDHLQTVFVKVTPQIVVREDPTLKPGEFYIAESDLKTLRSSEIKFPGITDKPFRDGGFTSPLTPTC